MEKVIEEGNLRRTLLKMEEERRLHNLVKYLSFSDMNALMLNLKDCRGITCPHKTLCGLLGLLLSLRQNRLLGQLLNTCTVIEIFYNTSNLFLV